MNERFWFGVTNPTFDVLGRTFRRYEESERSERARALFDPSAEVRGG